MAAALCPAMDPTSSLTASLHVQVVHDLYSGGAAVAPVEAAFPGVTIDGGGCHASSALLPMGRPASSLSLVTPLLCQHAAPPPTPLQPSAAPS